MAATDVWAIYEMHGASADRSHLSPIQRQVMAICDWRQEVNAGGFDSYFRYWGGDTAREALDCCPPYSVRTGPGCCD